MPCHRPLAVISLCCLAFSAPAAETGCPAGGVYSFYLENDLFYRSDRNYTSGIKLTYVSPDINTFYEHADCVPAAAQAVDRTLRDLFSGFLKSAADKRNIVTTLGQEIYTPGDLRRRDVIREDRPYAAWLYLGLAYNERRAAELDSLEVRLGMVGPLAFGRQAQDFIHELRGFDKFQGWANQLRNEPGVQLIAERRFRSFRNDAASKDVTFHYGGSIGNVATYVNAGVETRIGAGIADDFGSSPTRPAGNNTAPGSYRSTSRQLAGHFFAALDARFVVRDIFLDGNSFVHSHSVDKRPFVADLSLGAAVFAYGMKVSYARVLRSQEFKGQPSRHSFGSVTLSYAFD